VKSGVWRSSVAGDHKIFINTHTYTQKLLIIHPINTHHQMSNTTRKRITKSSSTTSSRLPPEKNESKDQQFVSESFETISSAFTGIVLLYGAGLGLFYLMQLDPNNSFHESCQSLPWTIILGFQMGIVLAPNSPFSPTVIRLLTYINCVLLCSLPHLPVCKRGLGAATGAAQGAASILVTCRAFQLLHRIEENDPKWLKTWGRWRRFYQGCGLSWHDLDDTCTKVAAPGHSTKLFKELIKFVALLIIPCYLISEVMSPPTSIFSKSMMIRCFAMSGALVASFNVFDLAYCLLISLTHGVAVKSIMSDNFWDNRTVQEIWKGWNLPIQRLLGRGVYKPLRKLGIPRSLASLIVFVVSGVGHIYPCYCAGLSFVQIGFMMLFFVVQVILVTLESVLGFKSRVWCIGIEILLSPLFVMPVMFFTDPAVMHL
jgi:hypothetical protein